MEKTERKSLHFVKEKITGTPFVPLGRIWMDYSYLKRKAAFNLKKKKKRKKRKRKIKQKIPSADEDVTIPGDPCALLVRCKMAQLQQKAVWLLLRKLNTE